MVGWVGGSGDRDNVQVSSTKQKILLRSVCTVQYSVVFASVDMRQERSVDRSIQYIQTHRERKKRYTRGGYLESVSSRLENISIDLPTHKQVQRVPSCFNTHFPSTRQKKKRRFRTTSIIHVLHPTISPSTIICHDVAITIHTIMLTWNKDRNANEYSAAWMMTQTHTKKQKKNGTRRGERG